MNGKKLLIGMSNVSRKLIDESENDGITENTGTQNNSGQTRKTFRRPFLIAAIIAMMLLLVGCAVVYVLSLQNLKIAETTETKDYRLVDGVYVEDPHEVSENILTLAGMKGSNAFQACADFYTFMESCDQEMYAEDNSYSKALDEKAAELAQAYGLKSEGNLLQFRTTRNLCDALGVERFYRESEDIHADITGGECWESGNFRLDFDFTFPENQGYEVLSTYGNLRWNHKDCFSRDYVTLVDSGDWIERTYTTASGSEVLILQSPSQERGFILCDRGDALMSLQLEINIELLCEDNGVVSAEYQHMTDKQIELVADTIDFAIQPTIPTQADVDNQPEISQSVTQNGWTVEISSVETDGYVAILILDITAPEGTVIPTDGNIIFSNHGELIPESGTVTGGGIFKGTLDDRDGLDHTAKVQLVYDSYNSTMEDGSAPYAAGTQSKLHIVDLVHSLWDGANSCVAEETLVEGEWLFTITFDESNGDYREIELLSEPITAQATTGWRADGTDVLEERTINSFKLRTFSHAIDYEETGEHDYAEFNWAGHYIYAVMKDGTQVDLTIQRNKTIDLDQVDYVLLGDGTKLMMPVQ